MPGAPRQTLSRAKEFNVILGAVSSPRALSRLISARPSGAAVEIDGVSVEYGNVRSLVSYLNPGQAIFPFNFQPAFAVHLDSVKAARKKQIEIQFGLPAGSITSQNSRSDVLLISDMGVPYFLSVKDTAQKAKLGQVSTRTTYGGATLTGGLAGLSIPSIKYPSNIRHTDTALSPSQFDKISEQDRKYAFYKKNHSNEWKQLVESRVDVAVKSSIRLAESMSRDPDTFFAFVESVLAGNLAESPNFHLLLGNRSIRFTDAMKRLRRSRIRVEYEVYRTRAKTSVIIWVEVLGNQYCLTKVEPAFDGGSLRASQTKGIIYYFQQHVGSTSSYKQLLLDIAK
jgi:hypothetical protein